MTHRVTLAMHLKPWNKKIETTSMNLIFGFHNQKQSAHKYLIIINKKNLRGSCKSLVQKHQYHHLDSYMREKSSDQFHNMYYIHLPRRCSFLHEEGEEDDKKRCKTFRLQSKVVISKKRVSNLPSSPLNSITRPTSL